MKPLITTILISLIVTLLLPSRIFAQGILTSDNYKLDNINFGNVFGITTSQGTIPIIASDGPTVIAIDANQATIAWTTDIKSTSTVAYGLTDKLGQETGVTGLATAHKVTVFGLEAQKTYFYKVISLDAAGAKAQSEVKSFTTTAESGLNGIRISDVSYDRALITWKTGNLTRTRLQFGTTSEYGQEIATEAFGFTTAHTQQLTGLTPGTEYHVRIIAIDQTEKEDVSSDFTFETIAEPRIESVSVDRNTANDVTIRWTTNTPTTGIINYRSDRDKTELSAGDKNFGRDHKINLVNLFGNTKYRFELTALDEQGRQALSGKKEFDTLPDTEPPVISDLKVAVNRSGDKLVMTATWKTNEPAKSKVSYAPRLGTAPSVDLPESNSLKTDHVVVASNILPATSYILKAISVDPFNNESESEINFVTQKATKNILALLAETVSRSFGWLINLVQ